MTSNLYRLSGVLTVNILISCCPADASVETCDVGVAVKSKGSKNGTRDSAVAGTSDVAGASAVAGTHDVAGASLVAGASDVAGTSDDIDAGAFDVGRVASKIELDSAVISPDGGPFEELFGERLLSCSRTLKS